jgi:hypothetical protein
MDRLSDQFLVLLIDSAVGRSLCWFADFGTFVSGGNGERTPDIVAGMIFGRTPRPRTA